MRSFRMSRCWPLALMFLTAHAQTALDNPLELLKLGAKQNHLAALDTQPWHLKASYEIFDSTGAKPQRGIYEVVWVSPKKYRQSFASKIFSQANYGTAQGVLRTGTRQSATAPERVIPETLFLNLPSNDRYFDAHIFLVEQRPIGGTTLRCVTERKSLANRPDAEVIVPSYCFDTDRPALRYKTGVGQLWPELFAETSFDQVETFRGTFVSRDIHVARFGKPFLHIHVDVLEDLASVDDASLVPPPDSQPAPLPPQLVADGEMITRLIKHSEPVYDRVMNTSGIDGRIMLAVTVGKDGRVTGTRYLGGSKFLQESLARTVRDWTYKPYLVNGEPVEVETDVVRMLSYGPQQVH